MKSRFVRHYSFSVIALFLSLILFVGLIATRPAIAEAADGIKEQAEKMISELIGVPVAVEDFKLDYTTIYLRNLKIGERNKSEMPFGTIGLVKATCDFMSLLGGNLVLNDVAITDMNLAVTRNIDGKFFPEKIINSARSANNMQIADLPFLNLSGSNLQILVDDKASLRQLQGTINSITMARDKGADKLAAKISGHFQTAEKNADPDVKGRFASELEMRGGLSDMAIKGFANIGELKAHHPILGNNVELSSGTFYFSEKGLETDNLSGSWGHAKVKISGNISDFKDFTFSFKFNADQIVLEEFSKAFVAGNGVTFGGSGKADGTIKGNRNGYNLTGNLNWLACIIEAPIAAGSKEKFGFPFKNVFASFTFDGKHIVFSNARCDIFGGRLAGSGKVQARTRPAKFALELQGYGLRVEQFLATNTSQKKAVSGPVDVIFSATGDSGGLGSMNGRGSLNMKNGHYNAPPVIAPILQMVNLKEFSSGEILSGQGTFNLQQGILYTEDLVFLTSSGKAYYRGQIGLDTTLKGKVNLVFAQEAVNRSRALQQISLDGRSASIPSNVAGTLLAPSFPGFSAQKMLELGLKRTGQKILNDILSPGKKESDNNEKSSEPAKKDPGKQILKELGKIFKF